VLKFAGNMLDYQANENYFSTYAPINYFSLTTYWSTCNGGVVTDDPSLVNYSAGCSLSSHLRLSGRKITRKAGSRVADGP
jgi:hypothetical protein